MKGGRREIKGGRRGTKGGRMGHGKGGRRGSWWTKGGQAGEGSRVFARLLSRGAAPPGLSGAPHKS